MSIVTSIVIPLLFAAILAGYTRCVWSKEATMDRQPASEFLASEINSQNERIYKDFEFFVKVFLALIAGLGYLRFEAYSNDPKLARVAMVGLGAVGLVSMLALSISIAAHQAAKIRRWQTVRLAEWLHWQESWLIIIMLVFSGGLWVTSVLW